MHVDITDRHTSQQFAQREGHHAAAPSQAAYGAFHKDTGALVGSYCLTLVSRGVWELGYRAVKESRGRGYSVEAARALCDWGWGTLDVHRIERWAMAGSTGSCAVAEKLGFTVERTLRSRSIADEGKPHGCWVGGLPRP